MSGIYDNRTDSTASTRSSGPQSTGGGRTVAGPVGYAAQAAALSPGAVQLKPAAPDAQRPELGPGNGVGYSQVKGTAIVGDVDAHEVHQGGVGTCYFLAALSSIAGSDKASIKSGIKAAGAGKWAVRFYTKRGQAFTPTWITVDQQLPTGKRGNPAYASSQQNARKTVRKEHYKEEKWLRAVAEGREHEVPDDAEKVVTHEEQIDWDAWELWPALYEKAYAIFLAQRPKAEHEGEYAGGYDDADGGQPSDAIEALTGRPAVRNAIAGSNEAGLFTQMNSAWRAHDPVVASATRAGGATGGKPGDEKHLGEGIYTPHSYTVLKTVDVQGKREVIVRNPWGTRYQPQDKPAMVAKVVGLLNAGKSWTDAVKETGLYREHVVSIYERFVKGGAKLPAADDDSPVQRLSYADFRRKFDSVTIGSKRVT